MPAGSDPKQSRTVGQAAMNHGEQHLVTLWLQFEGNVAAAFPRDGELAGWGELGDPALHPALASEAGRPRAGRVGQFIVTPDELERGTDLHLHIARRQPLAAQ